MNKYYLDPYPKKYYKQNCKFILNFLNEFKFHILILIFVLIWCMYYIISDIQNILKIDNNEI